MLNLSKNLISSLDEDVVFLHYSVVTANLYERVKDNVPISDTFRMSIYLPYFKYFEVSIKTFLFSIIVLPIEKDKECSDKTSTSFLPKNMIILSSCTTTVFTGKKVKSKNILHISNTV